MINNYYSLSPIIGSLKTKNQTSIKWFASLLFLLIGLSNYGQTTLISSSGNGGFESAVPTGTPATDFTANGWTVVNNATASTDKFFIGNATAASAGTYCTYSGTSAASFVGQSAGTVDHFYKDITFPAGETKITLTFKYKIPTTDATFDYLKLWLVPTTTTPVGGTQLSSGQIGVTAGYDSATSYATQTVTIPASAAGTTQRLVFSWRTDGVSPAAVIAIDEINLTSALPGNITANTIGGLWSSPATWAGGVVPSNDNVTIPAGTIITVDQVVSVNNLTISGTLQWNGTSNAMTIGGNLVINSGGVFLPYISTGATGQTVNIGGNFQNNGYANLAITSTLINFNGSGSTLSGSGVFQGDGTNGIIRSLAFQNTGSNTVSTSQNLTVTSGLIHTAGSLNTGGKLKVDNTAQIYGQAFNISVASLAVTNMGTTAYSVAPVVFGVAVTQWTSAGTSASNTRYVSGGNVYVATSTAGLGTAAPTHTSGLGGTNNNLLWLGTTGTLGAPWPYNVASTLNTQYFYGNNLYVATAATTSTTPPTHTTNIVVGGYLYIGTVAKASVNYDSVTGTVRSLNLTQAGSGYNATAPSIAFSVGVAAGTGAGAAASAVVFQQIAGPASALFQKSGGAATISGGLTINSDQGASASGNEQASSGVGALSTSNGGVNYSVAPQVGFAGPTALNLIQNPGSGYTATPTITVSGGTIVSGSAYTSASFTIAVNAGKIQAVYLTATAAVYSVPPTLTMSAPTSGTTATLAFPSGCWPSATPVIGSNGQILSFTLNGSGYGYVTAPLAIIGTTTATTTGGTFTTVATAPTTRIALYNLTLSNFNPSPAPVAQGEDAAIPGNRKINTLSLSSVSKGLNLTNKLTLFGSAPLTLTASTNAPGSVIDLGGNNLLFTWNGYGGQTATFGTTSNAYIKNGSMTLTGRGGASSFNFPFSGTFNWFAGSTPTANSTGSSVTRVTVSDTAAPTNTTIGNSFPIGARAFRVQYDNIGTTAFSVLPTTGTAPTITMNFNNDDALTAFTQDLLLLSDSSSLSGPWSFKSVTSGTGAITSTTTSPRTTATTSPGPIVPTGDNYYAWALSAPTITDFSPLTVCANSGTFTITGTNLTGVTNLKIGGTAVTSFTIVSATQITGVAGNGSDGFVSLTKGTSTVTGTQTITVSPTPSAPAVSPATASIVIGGAPNVTASGTGGTFLWYSAATGGTLLFTGPTYTLPTCSTTTLYVAENNGSCDGPRTPVVVTVQATAITASTPTFCGTGGTSTLSATPVDANISYTWTSLTGASISTTTGNSTDATIVATSDFLVTGTSTLGGCSSSATISVSVYPLPNATVTTTATGVCPGTSATINSGLTSDTFSANCTTVVTSLSTPPGTAVTLINGSGVQVTTGAFSTSGIDDNYWTVPVGFSFNFLGTSYSNIFVTTNGILSFTAGTTSYSFPSGFPSTSSPAGAIAVCGRDLYFTSGSSATLKYWVEGIAPNRKFIVQYANVPTFDTRSNTGTTLGTNSAEAVFYETVGYVDIRVINANNGSGTVPGNSTNKLIGLQNSAQNVGAVAPRCSPSTLNYWNAVTTEIIAPQTWRFAPPANYNVTWSTVGPGNTLTTIDTGLNHFSLTVSPSVTTTYNLSYTNTFTNCTNIALSDQVTMTILSNVAPVTTAVASASTICLNGSSNLSLTDNVNSIGNTDGLTYQWQVDTGSGYGNYTGTGATTAAITVTPTTPSTYQCLVSVCSGTPVPSSPVSITYTNNVDTTTPNSRCGTGTVVLGAITSSSGATLNWYAAASGGTALGTGTSFTTPSITGTTTYYVAAETTGCSSPRVAVTATVTTPPTITLSGPNSTTICNGNTAPLATNVDANYDIVSVSPSATGTYLGGGLFIFNPTSTTVYTITASQSTGSSPCATSFTYTVNVNVANATAAASASVVCTGSPVNLSVTSTAITAGPQTAPTGYAASTATSTSDEDILNVTLGTLNNTSTCTTTGGAGSSLNLYSDFTAVAAPTLTAGTAYPLTVQIGTCNANFTNYTNVYIDYNRNGTFEASEQAFTEGTGVSGAHTVSGTITIPPTATAGVTRMRVLNVEFGSSSSSVTGTYSFGETEDYNVNILSSTDATSTYTYAWSSNTSGFTANTATTTDTPTANTTYSVLATSPVGCQTTSTVSVTVQNSSAQIDTPPANTTKCLGGTATFTVAATGVSVTYQWRKGTTNLTNGGTISGATSATLTLTGLTAGDAGNYNVVVSSTCGSPVTSADGTLTVITPLAGINPSATTVCSGTSVTLTENGGTATSWSWSPGSATTNAITVTPAATTNYFVTATSQVAGCTATANFTINVNQTPTAVTVVPTGLVLPYSICTGTSVQVDATGGGYTNLVTTAETFDVVSPLFTAATVSGTTTTTATLDTALHTQGTGSVLFNTTGVSSVATYSLNSNVNLSTSTAATLTFSHIADMESPTTSFDYGYVEYSSDGGTTWTTFTSTNYTGAANTAVFNVSDVRFSTRSYPEWITAFTGTTSQPTNALWKNETFTVPSAALTNQFKIRFRYTTDSSTNYAGWWIDNVVLNATAAVTPQYSWTTTPTISLYTDAAHTTVYNPGTDFATSVYASPTTSGTVFNVTVSNGSCTNSGSASVAVQPLPTFTVAPITICNGSTGILTATSSEDNSYSWTPGPLSGSSVSVSPSVTTTYQVTATSNTTVPACSNTKPITVTVSEPGAIVTQPVNQITSTGNGATMTVAGTAGVTYTYQWQIRTSTGPDVFTNLSNDYIVSPASGNFTGVDTPTLNIFRAGSAPAVTTSVYRVILTPLAPCTPLVSNTATLTVSSIGIASNPQNVSLCLPVAASPQAQFTVVTNGAGTITRALWEVSSNNFTTFTTIPLYTNASGLISSGYNGPNTTAVSGLTFSFPLVSTVRDYKTLNVDGITSSSFSNLRFRIRINNTIVSQSGLLTISDPALITTDLSTTAVTVCQVPTPASPTVFSITTTGAVSAVVWKYATTAGASDASYSTVTTGTPAGATYTSSNPSAGNYSLSVSTTSATPLGNYYYKAFVTSISPCSDTKSSEATISVVRPAVSVPSSTLAYCSPGPGVTLSASGASTYAWNPTTNLTNGGIGASVTATPTGTTLYTVTGTDGNGCTNTATINVTTGTSFVASATSAASTVCPSTPVTLTSSVVYPSTILVDPLTSGGFESGATFPLNNWTVLNGAANNWFVGNAAGVQAGTNAAYVGTGNVATGVASVNHFYRDIAIPAGSTNINLKFYLKMAIIDNTFDYVNVYTTTTANTPVTGTLPGAGYTTVLSYTTPALSAYTLKTFTLPNALAGTTVRLVFTYKSDGVTPFSAPAIDNIELTTTPGDVLTYAWSTVPSSAFTSAAANPSVTPAATTSYNLTVTSSTGCSSTIAAPLTVNVDSAPPTYTTTTAASQTLCSGSAVSFAVSATSATPLTYQWKKNGVNIPSATSATLSGTTTSAASTASNFTSGTYTVDIIGCTTVTATFNLLVNPLATATVTGSTSVCQNDASPLVTFTGATGTAPYTFTYTVTGTAGNQTVTTTTGNSVTVSVPTGTAGSFAYTLVSVQDSNTCSQTQTGSATVIVNQAPIGVTATASPTTLCAGSDISLTSGYTVSSIVGSGMSAFTASRTTGSSFTSIIPATTVTTWRNGASTDDNLSDNQPIGFSFIYNGVTYTNFRVSTNGFMTFNTTSTATGNGTGAYGYSNSFTLSSGGLMVAPNWDDLQTAGNLGTVTDLNNSINYTTTGTTGNKVLTVEWKNMQDFNTTSTASYNMQVKLYEVDRHIEFVYGTMTQSAASVSYSLGLSAATVSTTPLATELLSQTTQNSGAFGFTNSTGLTPVPASNTKISFDLAKALYAWTGPNGFTSNVANPTVSAATTLASGVYNLVVSNSVTSCQSAQASTAAVTVNPNHAIALSTGSSTPTLCINTLLATNIVYAVSGGGTGAGVTGLPTGMSGAYAGGNFTISGTPTQSGIFNYTVTTTGNACTAATATGTITVSPDHAIALSTGSSTPTLYINTALSPNIVYALSGGATGAGVTGLPTGMSGTYAGGNFTISGTPTQSGTFPYVVTTTGNACIVATATGTITVNPNNTITLSSAAGTNAQTVCSGTPITTITYATTGATGATFAGLPTGVSGSWSGNVVTISGSPTSAGGTYTVTLTGGGGVISATGTITATAQPLWYLDADADGYYTGTAVPSCASPGAGYTTATLLGGGDCADNNSAINPGATEICYNNIDDNCNGTKSEGCAPVVVNMTPSYHNTTLASLATAIPAVPYSYPGATNLKYRFTITNTITGASVADIIQVSRFVNIPGSLYSSPGTFTITASAVINDEVVPYAGNTITVFGPTIPKITLAPVSCGATLAALTSTLTASQGQNATGYTFRIRAVGGSVYATSTSSTRFVSANSFAGFPLSYGTSYLVAVQYSYTDPVTLVSTDSGYGTECTITTPSIPTTTMASPTCGSTVAALNASISATTAAYATGYQFRIRLTSNVGGPYTEATATASRFSSLTSFGTLQYNSSYSVSVRYSLVVNTVTVWSDYGPECIVNTPNLPTTQLVASQCGQIAATSLTQQLNIVAYPGFPTYRVKLTEVIGEDLGTPQTIDIPYAYFRLNQFSIAQLGKNYNLEVAVKTGGVFGPYSTVCDVHTPAIAKTVKIPFKATAYPNPFANNFMLDVKTTSQSAVSLKVYDMVGRLIEQREVRVSDLETTTIGDRYPSGVYNVVVSQEDSVETVRVVKR